MERTLEQILQSERFGQLDTQEQETLCTQLGVPLSAMQECDAAGKNLAEAISLAGIMGRSGMALAEAENAVAQMVRPTVAYNGETAPLTDQAFATVGGELLAAPNGSPAVVPDGSANGLVAAQDGAMQTMAAAAVNGLGDARKYLDAPFAYRQGANEDIRAHSGHFVYECTEAVLPGKNGMDLGITLRFDSSKAGLYETYVQKVELRWAVSIEVTEYPGGAIRGREIRKYCQTQAEAVSYMNANPYSTSILYQYGYQYVREQKAIDLYWNEPGIQTSYTNSIRDVENERNNQLGAGWSFGFPRIEIDTVGSETNKYLHTGGGDSYKIEATLATDKSNLEKHTTRDMSLQADAGTFTNGEMASSYALKYKDGRNEYFGSDGRYIGTQDRYGNKITFKHTSVNGRALISKIIDACGREVNITYSVTLVTVSLPDGKQLKYELSPCPGNAAKYQLTRKVDKMDRKTDFVYRIENLRDNYFNKNWTSSTPITRAYALLEKVTYPTGSATHYTYVKAEGNLGSTGIGEYTRLASRKETDGTGTYNHQTFTYSTTGYTGYSAHNDPNNLPSTFTYWTRVTDADGKYTLYTFSNQHVLTKREECASGGTVLSSAIMAYDANRLPTRSEQRTHNGSTFVATIECATYNEFAEVKESWSPLAQGDTANTEHKTTATYHPTYHYPMVKSYKTDAATTLSEENTATADGKGVAKRQVYKTVAGVKTLVAETQYAYDSYGNVTQQTDYAAVNPLSGAIIQKFAYDSSTLGANYTGAFLTAKRVTGILNADGTAAENTPGEPAGEVVEKFTYDLLGRLLEQKDRKGNATTLTYDALGRKLTQKLPDNALRTWVYDDSLNTLLETDERGTQMKCEYSGLGLPLRTRDMSTNTVLHQNVYDLKLRPSTETTLPDSATEGAVITTSYDTLGRALSKEAKSKAGAGGTVLAKESYEYNDASGGYRIVTKTVLGDANAPSTVTKAYTDFAGRTVKQSRMNGAVELADTYTYDYAGRKLTEKTAYTQEKFPAAAFTGKWEYDWAGRTIKETDAKGKFSTAGYDALGRKLWQQDRRANDSGTANKAEFGYDVLGRTLWQTAPFNGTDVSRKEYVFDANGNVLRERTATNAPGQARTWATSTYIYNSRNQLTTARLLNADDTTESETKYTYDPLGNKLTQTTGAHKTFGSGIGKTTSYTYDRFGNCLTTTDPLGQAEVYTYNLLNNRVILTDRNGIVFTYAYDGLSRVTGVTAKDGATVKSTESRVYTLSGQKRSIVRDGHTLAYTYDALGRLTGEIETKSGIPTVMKTHGYDSGDHRVTLSVQSGALAVRTSAYAYDELGRMASYSEDGAIVASYQYDVDGNRTKTTLANNATEERQVNLANCVVALYNKVNAVISSSDAHTYTVNGAELIKTEHTGKVTTYRYDALNRLTEEKETLGASITTKTYAYDAWQNRTRMSVTKPGETYATTYTYDANDRLLAEKKTGTAKDLTGGGYNRGGYGRMPYNRKQKFDRKSVYGYDANGSQTKKSLYKGRDMGTETGTETSGAAYWSLAGEEISAYDVWDKLASFKKGETAGTPVTPVVYSTTATYAYRPDGLRSLKTTSKTDTGAGGTGATITKTLVHVWDGAEIVAETDAANALQAKYLRGSKLAAMETATGASSRQYYRYNAHGDTVQLCAVGGSINKSYAYDAFGNVDEAEGQATKTNPFLYTGQYYDRETETYYLRARYYNPANGRMSSEDRVRAMRRNLFGGGGYQGEGLVGGILRDDEKGLYVLDDPISLGLYAYCLNNPAMYSDPSGHVPYDVAFKAFDLLKYLAEILWAAAGAVVGYGLSQSTSGTVYGPPGVSIPRGLMPGTYMPRTFAVPNIRDVAVPDAIAQADVTTKNKQSLTPIFRWGGKTFRNMTPKVTDLKGLSFSLMPPAKGNYQVTTLEAINATGILKAVVDGTNHVSVFPVDGSLPLWAATREAADVKPHPYSVLLYGLLIGK